MSNKTQQNGSYEVVNKKCAGIDVHRDCEPSLKTEVFSEGSQ